MKFINVEDKSSIRKIELNRPDLHNAFNAEMISEITNAFQNIPEDVHVVQLSGVGPSFCAGADITWMKSMVDFSEEENKQDSLVLFDMFNAVRTCDVPVVTYVHGNVFGGGLGLVAASDIVAAEESTKFCFSEVKIGLVPAVISRFVLAKVNDSRARDWMLTARVFLAPEANSEELIHFSGTEQDSMEYVNSQIRRLLSGGRQAVIETKKLMNNVVQMSFEQAREESARVIAARRVSDEGQEGLRAFLEKRKPDWKVDG